MGLLDRFRKKMTIPAFSVGVFGKLPCYKEYFQASCHPVFADLKHHVDQGFDQLIRSGARRPYVRPDRRFFIKTGDPKMDLVGCLFESDDGMRGFPFMMAAPLPCKFHEKDFAAFHQILERVWIYLEAFYQHLKTSDTSSVVYNQIRDVIHQLDPFTPEVWKSTPNDQARQVEADLKAGLATVVLEDAAQEEALLKTLNPSTNPAFILWPAPEWWSETGQPVQAYLGSKGLEDMDLAFFTPLGEPHPVAQSAPAEEPDEECPPAPMAVPGLPVREDVEVSEPEPDEGEGYDQDGSPEKPELEAEDVPDAHEPDESDGSCTEGNDQEPSENQPEESGVNQPEESGVNRPEESGVNQPEESCVNQPEESGENQPEPEASSSAIPDPDPTAEPEEESLEPEADPLSQEDPNNQEDP